MQFGEQTMSSTDYRVAAYAELDERTAFIQRTYMHLSAAVVAFVVLEAVLLTIFPPESVFGILAGMGNMGMFIVFGLFVGASYIANYWASSARSSRGMQYAGLGLYVIAQALIFLPLMSYAYFVAGKNYSIPQSAGMLTAIIFIGLTAMVFLTKADFSWLGKILWIVGLAVTGLIVVSFILPGGMGLGIWFSAAMVAFAAAYILYDTSNVLHHYHTDQHVAASLALFASVALLFFYLIRLMAALRE